MKSVLIGVTTHLPNRRGCCMVSTKQCFRIGVGMGMWVRIKYWIRMRIPFSTRQTGSKTYYLRLDSLPPENVVSTSTGYAKQLCLINDIQWYLLCEAVPIVWTVDDRWPRKHSNEQEGISVECQPPAFWQTVLHSEKVRACLGGVARAGRLCRGPWPGPDPCTGENETRALYRDPLNRQTDTTENITFPQLRCG